MTVSVRLNETESALFKKYAEINNISISELFRDAVRDRIEDEYDLRLYNDAMEKLSADPVTYSHDEVKKMLGL